MPGVLYLFSLQYEPILGELKPLARNDAAFRPVCFDIVFFRAGLTDPAAGLLGARMDHQVEPMPNTSRPFVSFKAGSNYYFIQGHDMDDKVLLKVLLGRELKDHEKQAVAKEAA